ncbi:MAG: ATP-binding cassette domain-containing protein [Burkholderiales bacterium]|nr:ATP-binding cassette domain-containing protein [Burkholderiales bacterium]
MAEAGSMVRLEAITVAGRGHRALDGVNLALPRARIAVLGANGAGKSVLLRVLHGLLTPTAGRVEWAPVAGRAPRIAMVFQRPVLLRRSALDNVAYGLAVSPAHRAISAEERRERSLAALARVGLSALAERPGRVLSGGEQQRVALARAWALEPDVLLLDEPTASLDPSAVRTVEAIIHGIAAAGVAVVLVTHHRGIAKRFAERIVFLHDGRVAEEASTADFFANPVSAPARAYLEGELA